MEDTYRHYAERRYNEDVKRLAARLRRLADDVEQAGAPAPDPIQGGPELNYSRSAERIVHTMMWGMANLSLDNLVGLAAEATRAQQKGEK